MQQPETNCDNALLSAALTYAARGYRVFPCRPRRKAPLTDHGCKDATTEEATVRRWWNRWPDANVAIATGGASGLVVLDIDPRNGGDVSLDLLEAEHGALPETVESLTGGGGRHLLFQHPGGIIRNSTGELGAGLDIKADGGYIIAAPSTHPSGKVYEFEATHSPEDVPLAPVAEWLLAHLCTQGNGSRTPAVTPSETIPEGHRNDVLFRLACGLRAKELSEAGIVAALLAENTARCQPPLSEEEVRRIAESASRYAPGSTTPDGNGHHPAPWPTDADAPPEKTAHGLDDAVAWAQERAVQANGHAHEDPPKTNCSDLDDAAENTRTVEQERPVEDTPMPEPVATWECPDHLWRGPFARVADALGKGNWEIWLGTLTALAARAHRNLHFQYHGPLYGMIYALLVKPTGMGKGLATDVCYDLMPEGYVIRDAVQSGPALAPILAEIDRDKQGRVGTVRPRPALLLIDEFTTLLKNASIQHSTLVDTLNNLFQRRKPWNMSRSDRPNSGGGDVVIKDPTLTILATTTESLLKEHVSERMIRSGFLNRYIVLPGSTTRWKFYDPDSAGMDTSLLCGLLDEPQLPPCGLGLNVWLAYDDDARERMIEWGTPKFDLIMNSREIEAETIKRLHAYAHIISLLYAWGEQAPKATLEHVECSISVIETAKLRRVLSVEERSAA